MTASVAPVPAVFAAAEDAEVVTIGGTLVGFLHHVSRQGLAWATAVLVCGDDGSVDVQVPPVPYAKFGDLVAEDSAVVVTGRVDRRGDTPILIVTGVAR